MLHTNYTSFHRPSIERLTRLRDKPKFRKKKVLEAPVMEISKFTAASMIRSKSTINRRICVAVDI